MPKHGTYYGFTSGCRCSLCRTANTDYHRAWRAEQKRLTELGRAVEQAVKRSNKPTKKGNTP